MYFSYALLPGFPGLGQVGNMKRATFPTAFQLALFFMSVLNSILLAVY